MKRLYTVMIPTMTIWKRQNYRDSKKISSCQECEGGGKDEQGDLGDSETILYDTVMTDARHRILAKTYRTLQNKKGIMDYTNG